jgi:hypothetical protein
MFPGAIGKSMGETGHSKIEVMQGASLGEFLCVATFGRRIAVWKPHLRIVLT